MKKVILLIMVCLLISIPFSFANSEQIDAGEYLKDNGVLQGDETGDLMPDEEMTRAEMIKIFLTLIGVEGEAKNFPKDSNTFDDVSSEDWFAPYVGYAEVYGYTNGVGNATFAPNSTVTKKQVATFLLRGLGYDNAWEIAIEKTSELGINTEVLNEKAMLRREVFDMMKDTLEAPINGSEKSLGSVLGIDSTIEVEESVEDQETDKIILEDQAPPKVEALEVTGPETLEITFDEEIVIDALAIEVKERYGERNTLEIASIDQVDDETVEVVTQGQETATLYSIHIEGAKDTAGNTMEADTERTFSGISGEKVYEASSDDDENPPVVKKIQVSEPETVMITFNEKIVTDEMTVEVKEKYGHNKVLDIVSMTKVDDGTVKVITDGQSTATLYAIKIQGVTDTAGNVMLPDTDHTFVGMPK